MIKVRLPINRFLWMKIALPVVPRPPKAGTMQLTQPERKRRRPRGPPLPETPLQLPVSVWVTHPDGRRSHGDFLWADHPGGDCKQKVRDHRAAYIFVFRDASGVDHVFARPTSAEQYVRGNRTGKGWSQIRCISPDGEERRLSQYVNGGPGFVNPPTMTTAHADDMLKIARNTRVTERSYTIGQVASALMSAQITLTEEQYLSFVRELGRVYSSV